MIGIFEVDKILYKNLGEVGFYAEAEKKRIKKKRIGS